jgi:hypothetical protein
MIAYSFYLSLFNIILLMPLFLYIHNKYIKKIFSIPLLIFLMLILVYPVRGILILLDSSHFIIPGINNYNKNVFASLLIYSNISIILFFLGFLIMSSFKLKQVELFSKVNLINLYKKTYLLNVLLFFILFISSINMAEQMIQYGQVQKTIMGGINIYYSLLFSIKTYVMVFFAYFYFNYNLGKLPFFLVFFLTLIDSFISGSKSELIVNIIVILLIYKNGTLKLKYSYLLAGFGIVILTSVFANIVRFGYGHTFLQNSTFMEKLIFIYQNVKIDFLYSALNTLTHRFHGIDSLYNLYIYLSNHAYMYGKTLMLFFYAFYPRFLWPDKPDIAMGLWFGNNVFNVQDTIVSFWIPGEAFLNFGFFGIFLLFIYGAFLTYLDKKFHNNFNLFTIMIYVSIFLTIKTHEYTIAAAMSGLIKNLIPVFIYFGLLLFFYKVRIK